MEMNKCPKCNTEFSLGAKFCEKCGAKLVDKLIESPKLPKTKSRGKRVLLLSLIAVGIIAAVGAVLLLFTFEQSGKTADYSLIPVSNDSERWGYINRKGEYVINPQFEDANFFSEDGLARIMSGNGKIGYINRKGEYVIPAIYKNGTSFNDGLAFVVAEGGYLTCIDKKGNEKFVLNVATRVSAFSEGLAIFVTENGKHGFVDKTGKLVINAQFERALPFNSGFARIWQKGNVGFIDKTGRITINPQFIAIGNFSEEKAAFYNGKQWGYINAKGAYIINPQFEYAGKFSNGMAVIKQGRAYGYINKEGKLIINPQFDEASCFSDELAAVQSGSNFGYINKDGKFVINPQFEYADDFHNGIALVRSADKWGFINKKGQYVVNPQFSHIKHETLHEDYTDFVESDYYDASEFVKRFFERENGKTFDDINASTTLEKLANHTIYGADMNARESHYADYRKTISITNDIAISHIGFYFKTPIYSTENTYNNRGYYSTNKNYNFKATPDAIIYQFSLYGKAYEKRNIIMNALKTEIERRQGQPMKKIDADKKIYCLFQDNEKLSFVIDMDNATLQVAFKKSIYLNNVWNSPANKTE